MADPYFGERSVNRQRLLWTGATRKQLDRWEPFVAEFQRRQLLDRPIDQLDGAAIWQASIEHHFALIAARNLIRALELDRADPIHIDPVVRAELIEGRDLHEHWVDNMPVFNRTPRSKSPGWPSGKDFAARNPDVSPYWWLRWTGEDGPLLLPNVPAHAVHEVLDRVEVHVLAKDPDLGAYVPSRAASAWMQHGGEWWPIPFSPDTGWPSV